MSKDPIHLEERDTKGQRLFSPSAGRNKDVIGQVLKQYLPRGARVFEVASGTGEHALHFCGLREDIIWQPSDPDEASRQSQKAWSNNRPSQMLNSLNIDVTAENWWTGLPQFEGIFCANMIHIAPWEAALGMVAGAKHILAPKGLLFLYGPFMEGDETAVSNLEFDKNLKKRNSKWGVRDLGSVKHIFADAGFNMMARIVMPKENRLLIFST